MIVSLWTCFTLLYQHASISWSGAVRPWSCALTIGQMNATEGRWSQMRAIIATSDFRDGRRSRVSRSTVSTPHPSIVKYVTPSSRARSNAGSRAAIVK